MYRPVLVTAPTSRPLTTEDVKSWARIGSGHEDALISSLINSAIARLDGWTGVLGRCLCEQTWRQDFDAISLTMRLPLFPVSSISSITYNDSDGAEQIVSSADYSLQTDDLGAFVRFKTAYVVPNVDDETPAASITYVAGYDAVPEAIRTAMLLMIAHWYEHREEVVIGVAANTVPMTADALLSPYRRVKF